MDNTPPLHYDPIRAFVVHAMPNDSYQATLTPGGCDTTLLHAQYIEWMGTIGQASAGVGYMRFLRLLAQSDDLLTKHGANIKIWVVATDLLPVLRSRESADPMGSSHPSTSRPSAKNEPMWKALKNFMATMPPEDYAEFAASGQPGERLCQLFHEWQMNNMDSIPEMFTNARVGKFLLGRRDIVLLSRGSSAKTWRDTMFFPGPAAVAARVANVPRILPKESTFAYLKRVADLMPPMVQLKDSDVSNFLQVFAKAKLPGRGNKYPVAIPAVVCHCARHPMPTDLLPFLCFGLAMAVVVLGWWGWKQWTVARPLAIKYANLLDLSNQRAEELTAARQARDGFKAELEAAQREVAGLRETMGEMDRARDLAPSAELVKHYQTELIPGIVAERDQWHDWYLRTQEQMGAMQQKLQAHLERAVLFFAQTAGRYPAVEDMLAQARAALAPKPGSAEEKAVAALEKALREWEGKRKRWPTLESAQRLIAESEQSRVSLQRAAAVPAGKIIAGPDGAPASFTPAPVPDVRRA